MPKVASDRLSLLFDELDTPWADWVSAQLASVGIGVNRQLTTDPDAFTGGRLIVLDSLRARYSYGNSGTIWKRGIWAGSAEPGRGGPVVVRIDGAPLYDTWRGRTRVFTWSLDLVGRSEADARARLLELVGDHFELSLDAAPQVTAPVRFPGLVTVFLSYRRLDNASGLVSRLSEELSSRIPHVRHFLDITDQDPEVHIPTRLRSAISNAPVLLVLIGRHWLGRLSSKPEGLRIKQKEDFVRLEIAEALRNGIPLIVVLLEGARIPKERNLPADIRSLLSVERVFQLRDTHFHSDVDAIVEVITRTRIRRPEYDPAGTRFAEETVF